MVKLELKMEGRGVKQTELKGKKMMKIKAFTNGKETKSWKDQRGRQKVGRGWKKKRLIKMCSIYAPTL